MMTHIGMSFWCTRLHHLTSRLGMWDVYRLTPTSWRGWFATRSRASKSSWCKPFHQCLPHGI